jgi:hypothetical protein
MLDDKGLSRLVVQQNNMIQNDKDYIRLCEKIDDMINLRWELPFDNDELSWLRAVPSTDPQTALKTGVRTLSTVEPIPEYQPLNANEGTKASASEIEQNLLWQLKQSNKRSKHKIVPDIVESSLRYDKTVVQVIPLTWQLEGMLEMDSEDLPTRYKAAKKLGGFMVITHSPKDIHARFTPLGLDAVLSVTVMNTNEAIAFYGEKADSLREAIREAEQETWVTVYDYWDYEKHVVMTSEPHDSATKRPQSTKHVLVNAEMELPFLPWVVKQGGTSLETEEQYSARPMLGTIAHSDMWETQNIALSLAFGEALEYAASPNLIIQGPNSDEVRVDYGNINKPLRMKPGEDAKEFPKPRIDENLLHIYDRISAMFSRDTVARVLQDLDVPSGSAFATVNAIIKTATAVLEPYKQLAEETLSGVFELMLRWTHYTEEDMIGFGYHKEDKGAQYILKPKHIDTENIYIDVKLSANVPTDYLQRIEAAIALIKQLDYPKKEAYKQLDVPNPDQIIDERRQEMLTEQEIQLEMKKRADAQQLKTQQAQMQMQQQVQMQAQQMMARRQPEQTEASRRPSMSQAVSMNPARTGISPNQSNPQGNTRETRTNQDRGGQQTE